MSKVVEAGESLGKLLTQARQARKIALDRAAHDTRIRVERLRDIENDDFSHFTHPSYARMFLVDYARYLDLPVTSIKHLLPARGSCGAEGYEYLSGAPCEVAARSTRPIRPRRRLRSLVAGGLTVMLITLAGFELWKLKGNIERLNLSHASADVVAQTVAPAPEVAAPEQVPAADPADAAISAPPAPDTPLDERASFAVGGTDPARHVQ